MFYYDSFNIYSKIITIGKYFYFSNDITVGINIFIHRNIYIEIKN